MNNEDAIKLLKWVLADGKECEDLEYHGVSVKEAIEIAIKALEQAPILDKIRAEIKEWYWQVDKQALSKDPCVVDAMVDLFIRTIDKYKAESEEEE